MNFHPLPVGDDSERRERLRRLAMRYREPVVRYFLRRGLNRESAEDCAQDVFVRMARTDDTAIENPEAYLFTIAASVVVDHARRGRARQEGRHDPLEGDAIAGTTLGPDRVLQDRQALIRLRLVLDELSAQTRDIFLLNRLDGLTYTQLATRYGLSVKSIEKHMGKALSHLRKRFPIEERH
jgi:RNA polymerase sigma factor (sigma-70 family)